MPVYCLLWRWCTFFRQFKWEVSFLCDSRGRRAVRRIRVGPRSKSVGRKPSKAIAEMASFFQQEAEDQATGVDLYKKQASEPDEEQITPR